jgi:hypothetical protein
MMFATRSLASARDTDGINAAARMAAKASQVKQVRQCRVLNMTAF